VKRIAMGIAAASLLTGVAVAQAPPPEESLGMDVQEIAVEAAVLAREAEAEGKKRDPFRPFTLDLRPDTPDEPLTPLQRYEIPQLRLAGVLLESFPPRAMLEDNSGMGFIVTPGTPIGRNRGVVAAIESRRVVVEEKVLDFYGNEQVQRVVLEMPQENEPQRDSGE
jgi:type IV pilus assembly protein PilP